MANLHIDENSEIGNTKKTLKDLVNLVSTVTSLNTTVTNMKECLENTGLCILTGNWRDEGTALTINQMPSHSHGNDHHRHYIWGGNSNGGFIDGFIPVDKWMSDSIKSNSNGNSRTLSDWSGISIHNTGGGQAHSHFHVSPYMTVCVWERTA